MSFYRMLNKSVCKDCSSVKGGGLPVVCEGDKDGGGMEHVLLGVICNLITCIWILSIQDYGW